MKETEGQSASRLRGQLQAKSKLLKVVRVWVQVLNPEKKTMDGELVSYSDPDVGIVKRFVSFRDRDGGDGQLMPQCIAETLKARRFVCPQENREVPEFSLTVLPQQ